MNVTDDPVSLLLGRLDGDGRVIKTADRTNREYPDVPGGLDAGIWTVEAVYADEDAAAEAFNEFAGRDGFEVFHVPDKRYSDNEDPRRLLVVPSRDDRYTHSVPCDDCGAAVELFGVVDLYDGPSDVSALCGDCDPRAEADA